VKDAGMSFAIARLLLLQQLVLMIPRGINEAARHQAAFCWAL